MGLVCHVAPDVWRVALLHCTAARLAVPVVRCTLSTRCLVLSGVILGLPPQKRGETTSKNVSHVYADSIPLNHSINAIKLRF